MSVQLVIKSATQNINDFKLDCEWTWTIEQVKLEISKLYPTKPNKDNQKLIYGGKILLDHLSLKSILNETDDTQVVHLVCPMCSQHKYETKSLPKQSTFVSPPTSPNNTFSSQQTAPSAGFSYTENEGMMTAASAQYFAMQQAYMHAFSQYMTQYNSHYVIPTPATTTEAPTIQRPSQPPPRVEPFQVMDILHIAARILLINYLLITCSTIDRVIATLALCLVLGWFRRNNQEELRRAHDRRPATPASGVEETTPQENSNSPNNPEPQTQQSHSDTLSLALSLFKAFFTSLVPNDPVPVGVN